MYRHPRRLFLKLFPILVMKKSALFRRAPWLLAWGGSLALAYCLGSAGGEAAARHTLSQTAGKRNPVGASGGPLAGKHTPGAKVAGTAGDSPDSAGREESREAKIANFRAMLTDVATLPPGPLRKQRYLDIIGQWAAVDGEGALVAAGGIAEPLLRFELRETALRQWAAGNPEEAWKFAKENAKGDLPENRMQLVYEGLGKGDPATSLAFMKAHRAELEKGDDRISSVFDDFYERGNHDQLVAWAEKMPAGKMHDMAMNRIIDRWARYDPAGAKEWMDRNVTSKENLVPARIELAESWARVNPESALQWANSLPRDQRDAEYYNRIYNRWIQYDRDAAARYLSSQPPSTQLDRPIERYTYEVMKSNPADTMPWAESINDEKRRWQAIERVADVWRKRDPAALQNYVAAGNFSEDQKRQLLKTAAAKK